MKDNYLAKSCTLASKGRVKRIMVYIWCLFLGCVLIGCGESSRNENEILTGVSVPSPTVKSDQLERVQKIFSNDGFEIPCLKNSKVSKGPLTLENQYASSTIVVTVLKPHRCQDGDFGIFEKFASGRIDVAADSIVSYQASGKVFEHVIRYNIVGTNAIVEVTYLDSDGDGTFDTAFQSSSLVMPVLPDYLSRD